MVGILRCYTPVMSVSIPISCPDVLYPPEATSQGYRTEGQDAGMDTGITGESSYYPIPIVSTPIFTLLDVMYT